MRGDVTMHISATPNQLQEFFFCVPEYYYNGVIKLLIIFFLLLNCRLSNFSLILDFFRALIQRNQLGRTYNEEMEFTSEIEVNSGRVFTDIRSIEVNILKATIDQDLKE